MIMAFETTQLEGSNWTYPHCQTNRIISKDFDIGNKASMPSQPSYSSIFPCLNYFLFLQKKKVHTEKRKGRG